MLPPGAYVVERVIQKGFEPISYSEYLWHVTKCENGDVLAVPSASLSD